MTRIHQAPVSRRAMNLAHWITQNRRRIPDGTALVWRDRTWTWAEFDARATISRSR